MLSNSSIFGLLIKPATGVSSAPDDAQAIGAFGLAAVQPATWSPNIQRSAKKRNIHRIHGAGIDANIGGYIDGVHVTIYSIHGSYGLNKNLEQISDTRGLDGLNIL